jgi:catechol 2,3-dioxygenase-like lactoylglutathione lyase family enzyme
MSEPLPIRGLHHIALVTSQPEASTAFYRDVLGFRELPRPPFNFRGAWLYGYGMQIHIIENPAAADGVGEQIDTRANHVAFRVDAIEPVIAGLRERGIEFREQVNAGRAHQVFFRDPDGHHIEIAVHGDPSVGYVEPADR